MKSYSMQTMDCTIVGEKSDGSLLGRQKCYMIQCSRMNKFILKRAMCML